MSENARAAAGWLWLLTLITVITLASIAGGKHHPPPAAALAFSLTGRARRPS